MKLVAVTSCPTGIAHTYMAAEAIEQAAKAAGYEISVETQGAAGANHVSPEAIAAAGGILIALSFMLAQVVVGSGGAIEVTKVPLETVATDFNALNGMHWAALLFQVGVAAFAFLVLALAGFIAFAIADRPGRAPSRSPRATRCASSRRSWQVRPSPAAS